MKIIRQHVCDLLLTIIGFSALSCISATAGGAYSFTKINNAYQSLTGATALPVPWLTKDDDPYGSIEEDLGEFNFFGASYLLNAESPLYVSALGNLQIQGQQSGIIIDGAFANLDSISPNAKVSYVLEGLPGDHIVKIEWSMIGFTECSASNSINFQIWLYQKTGTIEMHYGPSSVSCESAYDGTSGAYTGIFQGPPDFSNIYQIFWLGGDAASPAQTSSFTRLQGFPPDGTVYRLTSLSTAVPETIPYEGSGLYPNPVQDRLEYIVQHEAISRTISILDMTGRVVRREVHEGGRNSLDLGGMQAGTYFLEMRTGSDVSVRKFTKL